MRERDCSFFAALIEEAFEAKKWYPLVSQHMKDLTGAQAREIQAALVTLRQEKGEVIAGYKAGFTAPHAQRSMGFKRALSGVLFASMIRPPGTVYQKDFARMFIEPEIGFRFGMDITRPITNMTSLKATIAEVFPAIELPDIAYEDISLRTELDAIVSNVSARKVLIGAPAQAKDLNAVSVRLVHDGREITNGVGKNALGDQWEALQWLVNDVLAKGSKIKSGYIAITGVISTRIYAEPGTYVADYGDFGTIAFECR